MNNILSEQDTKMAFDVLIEELDVKVEQLRLEAKLQQDLGADSLTLVEITMALEDRFNISIPDEEWEKVSTVGDLLEALEQLIVKKENRI